MPRRLAKGPEGGECCRRQWSNYLKAPVETPLYNRLRSRIAPVVANYSCHRF